MDGWVRGSFLGHVRVAGSISTWAHTIIAYPLYFQSLPDRPLRCHESVVPAAMTASAAQSPNTAGGSSESRAYVILIAVPIQLAVVTCAVGLRLYTRGALLKRYGWEDVLAFIAWVSSPTRSQACWQSMRLPWDLYDFFSLQSASTARS